jgi:hypothetical protein
MKDRAERFDLLLPWFTEAREELYALDTEGSIVFDADLRMSTRAARTEATGRSSWCRTGAPSSCRRSVAGPSAGGVFDALGATPDRRPLPTEGQTPDSACCCVRRPKRAQFFKIEPRALKLGGGQCRIAVSTTVTLEL